MPPIDDPETARLTGMLDELLLELIDATSRDISDDTKDARDALAEFEIEAAGHEDLQKRAKEAIKASIDRDLNDFLDRMNEIADGLVESSDGFVSAAAIAAKKDKGLLINVANRKADQAIQAFDALSKAANSIKDQFASVGDAEELVVALKSAGDTLATLKAKLKDI